MKLTLKIATAADVLELVSLRSAVAEKLTATFGKGHWSAATSEKGVLFSMRMGSVYVARQKGRLIATLALSTRKPWAIDKKYFSAAQKPLYLTSMAVAPEMQGKGIGRLCMDEVRRIAEV